jgi:type II secretory pathway pseudopilin PulG
MKRIITRKCNRAFTLLEVMIIVALIGLLAVMAMPAFMKVRKQAQGKRIVNDARVIDTAIDAWAMENNKADGDSVDLVAINGYSKSGQLRTADVLGNPYGIGPVGTNQVRIATSTKSALGGVSIDWGAY